LFRTWCPYQAYERLQSEKLSALALTFFVLTLGAPVLTRSQPRQSSQQNEQEPELVNIKGPVRADGNKIILVADNTGKAWDVVNPETLKSHLGHDVELSANVYVGKCQIHVMKVTVL
jgi:membrane protein implicated in regulation of membrane protease activity